MFVTEILIAGLLFIIILILACYFIVFKRSNLKKIKEQKEDDSFYFESYQETKESKKKSKIILNVLASFLILSSLSIFAMSLAFKINVNNDEKIVLSINSDSMATALSSNEYVKENKLQTKIYMYDVCEFTKNIDSSEIKLYDIVLYKNNNLLIAHRIININEDGTFETRGDNNVLSDKFDLKIDEIIGKYTKTFEFASFLNYLSYTPGFYVAFAGASFFIIAEAIFEEKEKRLIKN